MSKFEIYKFLKDHKKEWFTTKQLSIIFNLTQSSISTNLKKLIKDDLVRKKNKKNIRGSVPLPFYTYKK